MGILLCPNTQMIWFIISWILFFGNVPVFSASRLLSITITWVHRARLLLGKFASPFRSNTLPGISACFVCLVRGTTITVWNLLRLIESLCTMTTGLLSLGSDPFERWRFAQKTSPWQITIYPPLHEPHWRQHFLGQLTVPRTCFRITVCFIVKPGDFFILKLGKPLIHFFYYEATPRFSSLFRPGIHFY